jgi:hypothetical protein
MQKTVAKLADHEQASDDFTPEKAAENRKAAEEWLSQNGGAA